MVPLHSSDSDLVAPSPRMLRDRGTIEALASLIGVKVIFTMSIIITTSKQRLHCHHQQC